MGDYSGSLYTQGRNLVLDKESLYHCSGNVGLLLKRYWLTVIQLFSFLSSLLTQTWVFSPNAKNPDRYEKAIYGYSVVCLAAAGYLVSRKVGLIIFNRPGRLSRAPITG